VCIWQQLTLVPATATNTESVFGIGEFLAALALLLAVTMASDYRVRYRLAVSSINLLAAGFWLAVFIAFSLELIDVWFENSLPIPSLMNQPNNLRLILAAFFSSYVFYMVWVATIRKPRFSSQNANRFFEENRRLIHSGNEDWLQIIAEECQESIGDIIRTAKNVSPNQAKQKKPKKFEACAWNMLLLIADKRFCKVVVDKVPIFALNAFQIFREEKPRFLPIFPFARNIGQEFIRNTSSSFYQETSGFVSGYLGETKPVTNLIFGSYEFVEYCATQGESPLDTDYEEFSAFGGTQLDGFRRAAQAFLESYMRETSGKPYVHSYALHRLFSSFESSLNSLASLNDIENIYDSLAGRRLSMTVKFVEDSIGLIEKWARRPRSFLVAESGNEDIYDTVANLIFQVIFAASSVTSPPWTAHFVQHNMVWSDIFGFRTSEARTIIAHKVRRLLYNEVVRMNGFSNFKGARVVGFCLNVFGLTLVDRTRGYERAIYPLQVLVLKWTKQNFRKLHENSPAVAAACLQGSVSYDVSQHKIVKTYFNDLGAHPPREYLDID
jgi:hypothetical protein